MLKEALEGLLARKFDAKMTTTKELAVDFRDKDRKLMQMQFREKDGYIEYTKMNYVKIESDRDHEQVYLNLCPNSDPPSHIVNLIVGLSNYKSPD
jgi:hypothetical protein